MLGFSLGVLVTVGAQVAWAYRAEIVAVLRERFNFPF